MIAKLEATDRDTEAFATLTDLAERKSGRVPASFVARHVLDIVREPDWPVRRAALEALLRRFASFRREEMRVERRPPKVFGPYRTRRKGKGSRPYATLLRSLVPLRASCDCRDYVRNSLGFCKHVAAVLEEVATRGALDAAPTCIEAPHLEWDPVRPLRGDGDWLERVRLVGEPKGRGWGRVRASFGPRGTPCREACSDAPRRAAFVKALRGVLGGSDPALAPLLGMEEARLGRIVEGREARRGLKAALRTMERPLYPYQVEGVERFLASGTLLLADDMGLGKTAQAVAACHVLWKSGRVRRGLLLVPSALKPQWHREWRLFSDAPVEVVDGGAGARRELYGSTKRGFLIANYEQLLRDLDLMHAFRPDLIVLDEAQRIKNWATKTAVHVKTLEPRYRLVLTGTPMENRLDELASVMEWVDDMAVEPKWRLAPWHASFADGRNEVPGARNLDTLRARLRHGMVRRVRQEVLRQLPPRTDTVVPVRLTDAQADAHAELNKPIAQLVAIARRRPLTPAQFLRLMSLLTSQRIICNGLAQFGFEEAWPRLSAVERPGEAEMRSLDSPKLVELREMLPQLAVGEGRKVVVFSQWRRMLHLAEWATRDRLRDGGVRSAFFTGAESQRQRTKNLVEFHDDPDLRVLWTSDAGGVGLNLQRAADCCINLELPWNPAVLEQRIGRIHRLGQKRPINIYNFVAEDGIEGRVAMLVADKRALFKGLFDGSTDEIRFERSGGFLEKLERIIDAPPTPTIAATEPPGELSEEEADRLRSAEPAQEIGDDVPSPAAGPDVAPGLLASAPALRTALSGLRIEPAVNGGIRIHADKGAAALLGDLFRALGAMLPREGEGTPAPSTRAEPALPQRAKV